MALDSHPLMPLPPALGGDLSSTSIVGSGTAPGDLNRGNATKSVDPAGDPAGDPSRDPVSPTVALTSPKMVSMSSSRIPHVSGYKKYTSQELTVRYDPGGPTQLTNNKTHHAEESVYEVKMPLNPLLQHRRHLAHQPVEGPVRGGRQAGTLGSDT